VSLQDEKNKAFQRAIGMSADQINGVLGPDTRRQAAMVLTAFRNGMRDKNLYPRMQAVKEVVIPLRALASIGWGPGADRAFVAFLKQNGRG